MYQIFISKLAFNQDIKEGKVNLNYNTLNLIKIIQIFDHDEPSREKEAYITVRASDNGQPQLDDACTIKILIEDINDNQPVFDKVVSVFSVNQDLQEVIGLYV